MSWRDVRCPISSSHPIWREAAEKRNLDPLAGWLFFKCMTSPNFLLGGVIHTNLAKNTVMEKNSLHLHSVWGYRRFQMVPNHPHGLLSSRASFSRSCRVSTWSRLINYTRVAWNQSIWLPQESTECPEIQHVSRFFLGKMIKCINMHRHWGTLGLGTF